MVLAGIAAFWVATTVAALTEPGYSSAGNYLSELAARDATHAPVAIGAFLASAAAHAAGAYALLRTRQRTAGAALGLAALAIAGIACFRLSGSGPGDVLDTLHAASVVVYQVALVVAMLSAVAAGRGSDRTTRSRLAGGSVALLSTVLLVASLGSAADLVGGAGVAQRAWVAVDQLWLIAVTVLAAQSARASSSWSSTSSRASVL